MRHEDPGVPGALTDAVRRLADQVGVETLDRLWLFPPIRKGRREQGLVAAGCFREGDRRAVITLAYRAEETGKGIAFESRVQEEGEAPSSLLPRIMAGVVERAGEPYGEPRTVDLEGDPERFETLMAQAET